MSDYTRTRRRLRKSAPIWRAISDARAPIASLLASVLVLAACGSGQARNQASSATAQDTAPPASGEILTLYRESASIIERTRLEEIARPAPLTWRVHYVLMLEASASSSQPDAPMVGWLTGTLELTHQGDASLPPIPCQLVDAPALEAQAPDTDPARLQLPGTISLPAAETRAFSLFAPPDGPNAGIAQPGVRLIVTPRLLYDPTARATIHPDPIPIVRREHGTRRVDIARPAVYHALELDLERAPFHFLPDGRISVFQRAPDGELILLGSQDDFGSRAGARYADIRLGVAQGVHVSRRQHDFARDLQARRLVEELRITLANQSERDQRVIVREHLYRGRNWSIAYNNGVGAPRKIGSQTIRFDVPVSARASARIVYRVVYTWVDPSETL